MSNVFSRCRTCKHWAAAKDNNGAVILSDQGKAQGECHRMPPSVHFLNSPQGLQVRSQQPISHADMYCGEYAPELGVQQ